MLKEDYNKDTDVADVLLIGAGIMSTTLSLILQELEPDLRIEIYERLTVAEQENKPGLHRNRHSHNFF
ncbi:L-2-hydroxyglutarate oxidase LhgO [Pedobacter sp. UYEF25]